MKVKLDPGAYMPKRAHATDAGLDLRSPVNEFVPSFESAIIDTGVHVEIPEGYVGMLKSKSGLNVQHGITNEGVIDRPHGYYIEKGDKISQLVILPIITPTLELVDELEPTERGENGFGSTGK